MKLGWKYFGLASGVSLTLVLFAMAYVFPTFPGDEWTLSTIQDFETGWLTRGALVATGLGWTPVAAGLVALVTIGMLLLRRYADALMVLLSPVPMAAGQGLKIVVSRSRPDSLLLGDASTTLSFPSGHAVYAIIFGGILIVLIEEKVRRKSVRWALQFTLAFLILVIGASRVYLGLHWPSDVIGGFAFGGVGLVGLLWLRGRIANHK